MTTNPSFTVERQRHPIKVRLLTVKRITSLSPSMRRITFTGDDLGGFNSASFDDHVKLMVPNAAGEALSLPTLGESGLVFDENKAKPALRDYTPRRYDAAENELDIDFVLGHDGPATHWASQAEVGQQVGIAGPRGSFVVPTVFDWHLLVGDETALPAISRRLEELPPQTKAIAVIKTTASETPITLSSEASVETHWVQDSPVQPGQMDILESAVRQLTLPEGEGFIWAAAEYNVIKAIRQYFVEELHSHKDRIRASSYWRNAAENTEKNFD